MKLDDIRKLIDAATPGPWDEIPTQKMNAGVGPSMNGPTTYEDAQLIAASRSLLPKLLAVAEAAQAALDWTDGLTYVGDRPKEAPTTTAIREALAKLQAD